MRPSLIPCVAVLLMLVLASGHAVFGQQQLLRNPGFEIGNAGQYNVWWAPWDWYTFTVMPDAETGEMTYYFRNWAEGAVNLHWINGFPSWTYIRGWNPVLGGSWEEEYGMTPHADYSGGYDNPVYTGRQWIKKNPTNPYYSGIAQFVGCLDVGKTYEVSAWGVSSSEVSPPDMRILVDPNGGNDARTAPISSQPVPHRPLGRYWIWSSTGNHRIGNYVDYWQSPAPDVIGGYQIYDRVSVEFTATSSRATIFLLMDSTPWVIGDGVGSGLGVGWDNVEIREVHPPVTTLGAAKAAPVGTPLSVSQVLVTAVYPDGIYGNFRDPVFVVQDPGRSAGMMVVSAREVNRGDVLDITGTVTNYNGQKAIKLGMVTVTGSATEPAPLGMNNAASAGSSVEKGEGVDTLGMLVRLWGRVTDFGMTTAPDGVSYYNYFVIDDGSRVPGGTDPQLVRNASFETYTPGYFPQNWNRIQGAGASGNVNVLWGCNGGVGPHNGVIYVGRVGGTGRSWVYQTAYGTESGATCTAKTYAWAGGAPEARVRMGVCPMGGVDPLAASVVWSPAVQTGGVWQQLSVDFTAASAAATIFLECDHGSATLTACTGFDDVNIYSSTLTQAGVKVVSHGLFPSVGDYWLVTGILAGERMTGEILPTRILVTRDQDDGVRQQ